MQSLVSARAKKKLCFALSEKRIANMQDTILGPTVVRFLMVISKENVYGIKKYLNAKISSPDFCEGLTRYTVEII